MAEWIVRRLALAAARGMALAGGQAGALNLPVMTVQQAMSLPPGARRGSSRIPIPTRTIRTMSAKPTDWAAIRTIACAGAASTRMGSESAEARRMRAAYAASRGA